MCSLRLNGFIHYMIQEGPLFFTFDVNRVYRYTDHVNRQTYRPCYDNKYNFYHNLYIWDKLLGSKCIKDHKDPASPPPIILSVCFLFVTHREKYLSATCLQNLTMLDFNVIQNF